MLSVNQQTIAGAQQSVAKPSLLSNPKTGPISCPKTGRAARGLLSKAQQDLVDAIDLDRQYSYPSTVQWQSREKSTSKVWYGLPKFH